MLGRKTTPLPVECVAPRLYSDRVGKATRPWRSLRRPFNRWDWRESDRLPEPIFTPGHQGRFRPRREHQRRRGGQVRGARGWPGLKRITLALYSLRRGARPSQGHHPRRHQVRVRPDRRRRAAVDRRDDDADSSRYWPEDQFAPAARNRASTSSTCATTSNRSSGTSSRRCRRCRRRSSPGPEASTSMPISG